MPDAFDPYYDWLGIPPEDQPADHYRLLGVRQFESNAAAIANAADQRAHLLRGAQIGKRMAHSQKLLNEVAAASATLLNPERKRIYDDQLRERSSPQAAAIPPPVLPEQPNSHIVPPQIIPQTTRSQNECPLPATREGSALAVDLPSEMEPAVADLDAAGKINHPVILFGLFGGAACGVVAIVVAFLAIVMRFSSGDTKVAKRPTATAIPTAHAPAIFYEVNPEPQVEENPTPDPAEDYPPHEKPGTQVTELSPAVRTALADTAPITTTAVTAPANAASLAVAPVAGATAPAEVSPEPVKSNPLEDFATAVTLPKLPAPGETLMEDVLMPVALGPCKVDAGQPVIVSLKGGETIWADGKQRFKLEAAEDGTAVRDWEICLQAGESLMVVAKIGVRDQLFMFQWTLEGAQEPTTALLMNCALDIRADSANHLVALRMPVIAEPLTIDFEKPQISMKWPIENLPDSERVVVEVTKVTGLAKKELAPDGILQGDGDETILWTGPSDEIMILGLRLKATPGASNVTVAAVPQFQLRGMKKPEPYVKRRFQATAQQIELMLGMMNQQIVAIRQNKRFSDPEKAFRRDLLEKKLGGTQYDIELANAETRHLKQIAAEVSGRAQVNFRVYYQADDAQIDLLTTTTAAPVEAPDAN